MASATESVVDTPFRLASSAEQSVTLIQGHVILGLKFIPSNYVDCIVTSPPYWGLRDYGEDTATIWGGDENCEHEWIEQKSGLIHENRNNLSGTQEEVVGQSGTAYIKKYNDKQAGFCSKCGAWHGQLGLEPSPDLYIEHLRMVFAEVKRVLKKTGTCWINIGDSYASGKSRYNSRPHTISGKERDEPMSWNKPDLYKQGYQDKCMCMIPERFAFMMVDLGYILRNKIIWHKPNPMPSSVKDRFNTTYEMLYFFSMNKKYWFDLDAVREPFTAPLNRWGGNEVKIPEETKWNDAREKERWQMSIRDRQSRPNPSGKNPGDVWTINTQPFPEAHFAVFPEALPERAIKCSCPAEICTKCGKARVRITETVIDENNIPKERWKKSYRGKVELDGSPQNRSVSELYKEALSKRKETIGWTTCECNAEFRPGIVLDPFLGSGTTMKVARRLGMSCIGLEISPKYVEMAKKEVGWNEGLFGIEFHEIKA